MDKLEFMRACREGGHAVEAALRALDRAFFGPLHRDCMRAVHDADLAHDLVQETFIRVWQRCATFQGDGELLAWVQAILRNLILDRLRKPVREVPLERDGEMPFEVERRVAELSRESVLRPEDEAARRQLAVTFQRCWERFEQAHPAHATVMRWIAEDGLTNEDIAHLLGRTPGATREFVSQCRKRARPHFAEWYEQAFGSVPT